MLFASSLVTSVYAAGNPVLIVGATSNPFTSYYTEILKNEGLNLFDYADITSVTAATLSAYDVVILGEMPLTSARVNMFVNWVNDGGNLITMRPDKQLAGLLGLSITSSTMANAYLLIDTSRIPGLVNQTIQYHGTADLYGLSGATPLAMFYSTATAATPNPAVTVRSVGSNGGSAAAFLFDLARSIVYTRQGNPAWAGQERDGFPPIRSDDLFFGPAESDPKPDWVDRSKIAIPQADELQRLLANLILRLNAARKPLPRFWYFPNGKTAVVIMTGDDHASGGTAGRFDSHKTASPAGCSLANWECIRSTSYIYTNTPISDAEAAAYNADGFEIGLHVNTNCADYTSTSLPNFYTGQLTLFAGTFPSLPAPNTNRTHCIAWSDWATQAEVELSKGIRLDTNYYYWPPSWVNDVPGFMTGSGMPMRFARTDGSIIDVYQAATQMTDESGQTYPQTIDALLDNAVGPLGYFGAFTANIHTDSATGNLQLWSDQVVASAKARGVPVITSRQMLVWLDGRNGSSFSNTAWSGSNLTFTLTVGAGATGLQTMVPANAATGTIAGITVNGAPVSYTTKTIKGVLYAVFAAAPGNYVVSYSGVPISVSVTPISAALGPSETQQFTATVTGTPNTAVTWSLSPNVGTISAAGLYSAPATLTSTQEISVIATSVADPSKSATGTVTLIYGGAGTTARDTTIADFTAGTGVNTYVSEMADGEVIQAPALGSEFSGTALSGDWSVSPWGGGGAVTVSGGRADVDGARLDGPLYSTGRVVEFVATFSSDAFQHGGFGIDMNAQPWAIFSTGSGGALRARTNDGSQVGDTLLPGSWLNEPHRYRIEWTATAATFYIDGTQVASQPFAVSGNLRPLFSDFTQGSGSIFVDWIRVSPYASSSTFTSRIFDAGAPITWGAMSWNADVPSGASLTMRVRTGNTPTPDASWSALTSVPSSGSTISVTSQYIQYEAQLATADPSRTVVLHDVTLGTTISNVTVTNLTHNSATVRWSTSVAADSQVEYGTTAAYGQVSALDPALVTSHSVGLTGLSANTLYHYRVRSRNASANLFVSEDFTFTTKPTPTPPAISNVVATPNADGAVITWTTNEQSNSAVNFGNSPGSLPLIASDGAMVTSHSITLSGLPNDTYHYRVTSCDAIGNCATFPIASNPPLTFTTVDTAPPVISNINDTPSSTSASIGWVTDEPATSRVNYGTSPTALSSTVSGSGMFTTHSLNLTGLTPGTTYYYRVVSVDSAGNSATSPVAANPPNSFTTIDTAPPVISAVTAVPGIQGIATIRWTTNKASNSRVDYGTSPGSLTLNVADAQMVTAHSVRLTGLTQGATYYFRVTSTDAGSGSTTHPAPPAAPVSFIQSAFSVWNAAATPAVISDPDTASVELGMKFQSDVAGIVSGILFYKGSANTGTHIGNLWSSSGANLASVAFSNETASGWQQATFSNPVTITPNTTYVISYFAPAGRYSESSAFFTSTGVNSPPLRALANGVDGGNAVYRYGNPGGFPTSTFNANNYWVDVVFVDNVAPAISNISASPGGATATVTWTTNEPTTARVDYGTTSSSLNQSVTVSTLATSNSVTLTGLTQNTIYYYRVTSTDPSQNSLVSPAPPTAPLSFTTGTGTPPVISAVTATPGSTSAIITWTTNVASNSRVDYGTSVASLNLTASNASLVTSHSVALSGLTASTTYFYRVTSADAGSNSATSPQPPTAPLSFVTTEGSGQGPGNPPSEWDISGAGAPSIQGFTTDISYNVGDTVRFKIDTDATSYRLDIYRMGYYQGDGALKIATVNPSATLPQNQPNCLTDSSTGLIDCGNWAESASWTIPTTAKSGIYFAKAVRQSGAAGASHIVFVVRNDASTSDIVFQTSDTTWQAYNQYGGNSLYVGSPAGRAYKVSYNRPFTTRATSSEDWVFNAEYPMVRWLEANGYNVTYTTGVDTDRRGNLLLNHKVFLSVGHDEYWSGTQRANVEAARGAGVNLAFFSGNEIFWKTRWENSISAPSTAHRTLVSYKETHADAKIDPTPAWTGTWRDPRSFNPEGGRPENALTGTIFTVNCCTYAITVPEADGNMRFWRNTTVATLGAGQTATLPNGTLGYEWDEDLDNGSRPAGLIRLSTTTVSGVDKLQDFGSSYASGTATHSATLYRHSSGALVFSSGSVQWSWGLDENHDRGSESPDIRMQQATVNLFADMGIQPANLQTGLVPAVKSTDTTAPTSTIANPSAGATLPTGSPVTMSGSAADSGGGVVGGVEVSVDGGTTWRRANGRASWSFTWTPTANGPTTLMSRATDDSGNIQTPPASINVTVGSDSIPPVISAISSSPTATSAVIAWTTNEPANARVDYGTSPAALTQSVTRASLATTHSLTLPGLTSGATYHYRVTSADAAGNSATSPAAPAAPLQFTTGPDTTAPAITNITSTPNITSAVIGWTTNESANARVDYGTSPGALTQSVTRASLAATHSLTLPGLTSGTTYHYRVTSADSAGNSSTSPVAPAAPLQFTTSAGTPPVISGVAAAPTGTTSVITWTTNEAANARVDYGTSPTALTLSVTRTSLATSHSRTLSGLTPATTYYYRVTSADAQGSSTTSPAALSPPLRFTTAHFAASTTVLTGTFNSGNVSALTSDNNVYYQVSSTTGGLTRTAAWYGSFTGVPSGISNLRVTYRGSNSATATETVSIWNWTTNAWVQLDSRNVGTSEVTRSNLAPPGSAASYISGGQLRIRIQGTRTLSNFTSRGEWMQLLYNVP